MIKKILFDGYKAFDHGEMKVRPITVLLGANSVGKTSVLQLFLMLRQTALADRNYKSALKLYGEYVSMGEVLNIIRKKDNKQNLSFSVELDGDKSYKEIKRGCYRVFLAEYEALKNVLDKYSSGKVDKDKRFNAVYFSEYFKMKYGDISYTEEPSVDDLNLLINELRLLSRDYFSDLDKDNVIDFDFLYDSNEMFLRIANFREDESIGDEWVDTYKFLNEYMKNVEKNDLGVRYELCVVKDSLGIKKMQVYCGEVDIVSIVYKSGESGQLYFDSISSDLFDCSCFGEHVDAVIRKMFYNPKTIFSVVDDSEERKDKQRYSVFANVLKIVLRIVIKELYEEFDSGKINYVSPVRAHPKRYYFLDKAKVNASVDTLDGDSIAEILRQNEPLRTKINGWFNKFDINVDVTKLEDVIHRLMIRQGGLDLYITDVGFGISQVLPVIMQGFLSSADSITIIEQPEIHLHPKMQAELADLFIDIVLMRYFDKEVKIKKYLIIETHSEYLLKRLRRRISDGTISSENVAIYLVDPQTEEMGANIRELHIDNKGDFEWPVDFYGGELLRDTTEFLKNQI